MFLFGEWQGSISSEFNIQQYLKILLCWQLTGHMRQSPESQTIALFNPVKLFLDLSWYLPLLVL